MTKNLHKRREAPAKTTTQTRRIRPYDLWGFVILGCIAFVAILGAILLLAFDTTGADPQLNAAFYVVLFLCALLSVGLLYVLFTLRSMFRLVREQAVDIAATRRGTYAQAPAKPVAARPTPIPPVEYREPAGPSRPISEVEGIGPVYGRRLARHGVESLRDLRAVGPEFVAEFARVSPETAQRWKSQADLMSVPAIDGQAAEVLVHCDVHNVEDLVEAQPQTLYERAQKANTAHENRLAPEDLTRARVSAWIEAARAFNEEDPRYIAMTRNTRREGPATARA